MMWVFITLIVCCTIYSVIDRIFDYKEKKLKEYDCK